MGTFLRSSVGLFVAWVLCAYGRPATAQSAEPREEAVRYSSGDVRLAATLVLPPGSGPHPAVVLLHGAEGMPRTSPHYRATAHSLVISGSL